MVADSDRCPAAGGDRPRRESADRRTHSSPVADRFALLSLALTAIVFAVDLNIPLGVAVGMLYTLAVLAALKAPSSRFAAAMATACCVLTVAKMFLVPDRGTTELWKVVFNRALSMLAIGLTAFLGLKRKHADERRREAEALSRLHLADLAHMARLQTASQLAEALAHELNQPLAAVALQADLAARTFGSDAPPPLSASLREIAEQSERAGQILRALRRFVEKAEPHRDPIAWSDLIQETAMLFRSQAARAHVELEVRCEGAARILGDRIQLEQVLLNLLQNALDSIEASGTAERRILVEAKRESDEAVVRVSDTGGGIPPEDLERIFERFRSAKRHGLGLGLALCRSILESHGGRLEAQAGVARGAVFVLRIPSQASI